MAALATLSASLALAATPPNTPITNTATASYGISGTPVTVTGSVTVSTASSTPAAIAFLQHVSSAAGLPAGTAISQNVPVTQCNTGAGFAPLAPPRPAGGAALTVPGAVLLAPASLYASGDPVFVRVIDYDQNLDPLVAETVVVTVSSDSTDTESLRLTESGPSTGVFIGALPSSSGAVQSGNCVLNVAGNSKLLATYLDQSARNTAVTAAALVDPLGLVFDAATGLPVNGAQVTLIDMATGQPAMVMGNDGTSRYPSTVTSGASVSDSAGTVYTMAAGRYQFPRIPPGTYRLAVTPPANYAFASQVTTSALQGLPNAPFFVVPGSRGENFEVPAGPTVEIDLPLDPAVLAGVRLTKTAGKAMVAVGDFVPYTISIGNGDKYPVAALRIADRLPPGFRYQAGSARLDGASLVDPLIGPDGRTLEFRLGTLPGSGSMSLRYVAAVSAGAQPGQAENTAQALGSISSNVARASVLVNEDLNRSRSILLGRVTQVASCEAGQGDDGSESAPASLGLKGVRVLLEDGTYIITDQEGRWHADNLRPGTHVVQLDETSLPAGFELQACEQNTRTGGRNFSQIVNLRGGTLWRADFRLKQVASCMKQHLQVQGRTVQVILAAPVANQAVNATVMLPAGSTVVEGSVMLDGKPLVHAEPGDGMLTARLGAQPARWRRSLRFELQDTPSADLGLLAQVQPIGQATQGLPPLRLKAGQAQADQCVPITLQATAVAAVRLGDAAVAPASAASPQLVEKLVYNDKWLAAAAPGVEWLHPQTGFVPALPVIKVAVKHAPRNRVTLTVNGQPVNPLRYEGSLMNAAGTLELSNWSAVDLRSGPNVMEVSVRDAQGEVVLQESRTIHYAIGPATAVFDAKRSQLLADGRTPPVVALRMLDKDGQPVRRGTGGEFQVAAPYLSKDVADAIQREPLTGNLGGKARYEVGEDGVSLITLQPTTQAGEVVLSFDFGNNRKQEVRTWLAPDLREWVLVGFAEGTVGFKKLSGNMESLQAADAGERLFDQNRVAFYAKGQVKGEYLMTLAYDTAKEKNAAGSTALNASPSSPVLNQMVDPNRFYTLYADATQPQFDAASARKLYLKIEKAQFYAMFGDYDTSLSITELGRYSRTLNGFKSEYKAERLSYNAFASVTAQSFRKDEIQGDGTSGLYRLVGRDIVVNSDKVRVEVRDRFRPEIIISSQSYTRYLDYQIDPALGTLFFREPIPARDANFNPVFIVAEYESGGQGDAKLSYGGRVALKVGDNAGQKSELGFTRIHEGNVGREATLTAADSTVRFGETTKLRTEVASSQRNSALGKEDGKAYLVELSHVEKNVAARAYARQQDLGFGLGQQAGSETGTRKLGADARLQLDESVELQAETYRQTNLVTTAERDVLEARGQWKNEGLTTSAGVRAASETDGKGQSASVRQLITGMGYELLDRKMTLRASNELDLGSHASTQSTTFPNRLILGVDYRINPQVTAFAQHELARSGELKADTTRVGLRTQPWTGSEMTSSLGNQTGTDSQRLYGNLGMVQKVQINEQWAADFGMDRSQTLRGAAANAFGPAQPLASGTIGGSGFSSPASTAGSLSTATTTSLVTGDYTALFVGGAYKSGQWSGNARLEWRGSDTDTKINFLLGAQRNLDEGRTLAAGLIYNRAKGATDTNRLDTRLSYAYRPLNDPWIWLDRLQCIHESTQDPAGRLLTRKLINNLNANWMPDRETQIALQYGLKYVRDTIDSAAYKGFTDLVGIEARQNLGERWDIGLHGGMLHSWQAGTRDYQLGASIGFKLADNAWLSVGYNQRGFLDTDFAGAEYRVRGIYLNLRVKFDQDTFHLNDRNKGQFSLKP